MGIAAGLPMLILLRLGCGLFEAGAYPLASGIVRNWMPASARATASGVVAVGGRLGGAIAPPLTILLAGEAVGGWRIPFAVYGLVGMAGAVAFFVWFRNWPAEHPQVNDAERTLIGNEPQNRDALLPPIGAFLTSVPMWLCSLVQFISNFAWVFILSLFPSFLSETTNLPDTTRAWYQAIPLYAGIVGMLLGGTLGDFTTRRFGPRWGRALPIAGSRLAIGAAYAVCLMKPDATTVLIMMIVVAFATDLGMAPMWAWTQDVGGRHTGAVMGWANMWGNFGAAIFPLVAKQLKLSQPDQAWPILFGICAASQIVAALAATGIDARKRFK
jgi:MFS family permease